MGLFSSKKKTYVSSVVYNLAGEEEDRVDYLKYTTLNALMQDRNVAEAITDGYLRGKGMNFRAAYRYARDTFTWGLPNSNSTFVQITDNAPILAAIDAQSGGLEVEVVTLEAGIANYNWWAEREMCEKYLYDPVEETMGAPPPGVEADAVVSFDVDRAGTIYLEFLNSGSIAPIVVKLNPADYKLRMMYVYSLFRNVTTLITKDDIVSREFITGDTNFGSTTINVVERNGEENTTTTRIDIVTDGVTTTTSTKETVIQRSRSKYFLYRLGAGQYPAIDALSSTLIESGAYFPAVPLRVDNQDWTTAAHKNKPLYKTSKKLLGHLGLEIDDLSKTINSNQSVKDIDYAFVVQGVPINTKSQASQLYLFEFFDHLRTIQSYNKPDFDIWKAGSKKQSPLVNSLEIFHRDNRKDNYDIKLSWQYVTRTNKAGTIKPGARVNDIEVVMGAKDQYNITQGGMIAFRVVTSVEGSSLYIRKQISETQYSEIEVCGLVYENFVYKGKSVEITAQEVFSKQNTSEPIDGLLIPMNINAVNALNIRWRTQLAYECSHMVFNCYQVVKQKWYQSGLFKLILAIVAIVVIIWSMGTATGAVASAWGAVIGVLGTIGIVGLLASIIAASLYYLASMVLLNLLTKVAVNVLGETWGRVVAAIAMIVIMNAASAAGNTTTAAAASTPLTAVNILKGLSAVNQVYSAYAQGQAIEIYKDIEALKESYTGKMEEIDKLTKEMLGNNLNLIDIEGLIAQTQYFMIESPGVFFGRTLMLGSEVAATTNGMITNFAQLGLQLELPTTA